MWDSDSPPRSANGQSPGTLEDVDLLQLACPVPATEPGKITLGHGSGGKLTADLVQQIFLPAFRNPLLEKLDDQAVFEVGGAHLAFTTDSFVVSPLFFPGGDIGHLAVNGTLNDLAMSGATPLYLACAFILEEGFAIDDLKRVVASMQEAAARAGVAIVTGDTKVVERGHGDGIFITTTGVGVVPAGVTISADRARPGDQVLVSGQIAQHGMAIMARREGLDFDVELASDTAALHGLVQAMLAAAPDVHVLRDPTRGGLASTLNEIAQRAGVGIVLEEESLPLQPEVEGLCEILGLDPLYVANEGKLIAIVPAADAAAALAAMRAHPLGAQAAVIGAVVAEPAGVVYLRTCVGGSRIVDVPAGEQLPRIC
ncbi:MAG TPA: hydrogenase expression/formation protein HypE [Chloroflexota bacterium]|nr:hydrogenase expression/formation protein HypE [Chloroflexota bacterium]